MRKETGGIQMNKKKKNRKHSAYSKQDYYPKPYQRVDDCLAKDVKLALSLGWSDDKVCKVYKITPAMLIECKKFKEEVDDNVSITKVRR